MKILVDSTCDLQEEEMQRYDIRSLPLRVKVGECDYKDKVDIQVDDVFVAMRNGIVPQTSQPSLEDIINMFTECAQKGEDVIYLCFSSKLSGTYQTVYIFLEEMSKKYPDNKFRIIDTKAGSIAIGLMAIQGARLIEQGHNYEEVVRQMKFMAEHVEHIFTLADLSWLVKGGRISKTMGLVGNMLNIKPIIEVSNGEMQVIHKVRGQKKTLGQLVDIVEQRIKHYKDQTIGIAYAADREFADSIEAMIRERLGDVKIVTTPIGSVLGSHLGLSGVGICFFNAKN
ncbi:MAG: DegV family protein [Cellulosilyticaceae bacterium]